MPQLVADLLTKCIEVLKLVEAGLRIGFTSIMSSFNEISLGTLVPNSRDRHEKQWRPDFTHHKTHPKMRFVCEKQTEVHF